MADPRFTTLIAHEDTLASLQTLATLGSDAVTRERNSRAYAQERATYDALLDTLDIDALRAYGQHRRALNKPTTH